MEVEKVVCVSLFTSMWYEILRDESQSRHIFWRKGYLSLLSDYCSWPLSDCGWDFTTICKPMYVVCTYSGLISRKFAWDEINTGFNNF